MCIQESQLLDIDVVKHGITRFFARGYHKQPSTTWRRLLNLFSTDEYAAATIHDALEQYSVDAIKTLLVRLTPIYHCEADDRRILYFYADHTLLSFNPGYKSLEFHDMIADVDYDVLCMREQSIHALDQALHALTADMVIEGQQDHVTMWDKRRVLEEFFSQSRSHAAMTWQRLLNIMPYLKVKIRHDRAIDLHGSSMKELAEIKKLLLALRPVLALNSQGKIMCFYADGTIMILYKQHRELHLIDGLRRLQNLTDRELSKLYHAVTCLA